MRVVEKRGSSKIVLEEPKAILHQGHRVFRWPTGDGARIAFWKIGPTSELYIRGANGEHRRSRLDPRDGVRIRELAHSPRLRAAHHVGAHLCCPAVRGATQMSPNMMRCS